MTGIYNDDPEGAKAMERAYLAAVGRGEDVEGELLELQSTMSPGLVPVIVGTVLTLLLVAIPLAWPLGLVSGVVWWLFEHGWSIVQ